MKYISTRQSDTRVSASRAIVQGLGRDGGLFVPEVLPRVPEGAIGELRGMGYNQRAVYIMKLFLEDFTAGELDAFTRRAYGPEGFDTPRVAPVRRLDEKTSFLELWHGPTCAFKDMALQILPYLLTASMEKTGSDKDVCILVATSGDTGKAALEGFADVERTRIMVIYPQDGVSDIQKLQMTTQRGGNVNVMALRGNFDDAQTAVKEIFSDPALRQELAGRGWTLSSANSINWGRLLPQIVYYFSAYCDLLNAGDIREGEKVNFCVPTGNFGDILAGYYAKRMGLSVGRLICASNANDVLTDFIRTGVYDRNRPFHTTISPSMDILVSSNLERLLFDLSGGNGRETAGYMSALHDSGRYEVSGKIKAGIDGLFSAGCCGDGETMDVIAEAFRSHGYLIDPHTAVAFGVLKKYRRETGDDTPAVVVSTASPYKFCGSVLTALGEEPESSGVELIGRLEALTGTAAPAPLKALAGKAVRFTASCDKAELTAAVREFLK